MQRRHLVQTLLELHRMRVGAGRMKLYIAANTYSVHVPTQPTRLWYVSDNKPEAKGDSNDVKWMNVGLKTHPDRCHQQQHTCATEPEPTPCAWASLSECKSRLKSKVSCSGLETSQHTCAHIQHTSTNMSVHPRVPERKKGQSGAMSHQCANIAANVWEVAVDSHLSQLTIGSTPSS